MNTFAIRLDKIDDKLRKKILSRMLLIAKITNNPCNTPTHSWEYSIYYVVQPNPDVDISKFIKFCKDKHINIIEVIKVKNYLYKAYENGSSVIIYFSAF